MNNLSAIFENFLEINTIDNLHGGSLTFLTLTPLLISQTNDSFSAQLDTGCHFPLTSSEKEKLF